MIRILYDDQIFRLQQYGGISRYFCEVVDHIDRSGAASAEVFAPLYCNEYIHVRAAAQPKGVKFPPNRVTIRMAGLVNMALRRLLVGSRNDIDIYHETYYFSSGNCPATAKRIITVFDMIHEKFSADFSVHDKTRDAKAAAIARADHIICISESTRRDVMELAGVPAQKTSVVYLGHSLSPESPAMPLKDRSPFLLYVGSRRGYKNFHGLLRAYSRSSQLKRGFSIVCFGGGEMTASELKLIAELSLPPGCVVQIGGSDSTLAGLYASAGALVYPSLYEGFGIPPLEAMALDCPVVCSNTSSMPEVVGDAAELFDPSNIDDMRAAIERVVLSSVHGARLVSKGRERIKQFSWEKCARDTVSVYQTVLESERP